jgi:hypothetical protein
MEDPVPRPTIKKAPWPAGVIYRYLLFQIPGWALWVLGVILIRQWVDFPRWVIFLLFLLWAIKDALLFPLVWPSYDVETGDRHSLIGCMGIVVKALSPRAIFKFEENCGGRKRKRKTGFLGEKASLHGRGIRAVEGMVA